MKLQKPVSSPETFSAHPITHTLLFIAMMGITFFLGAELFEMGANLYQEMLSHIPADHQQWPI